MIKQEKIIVNGSELIKTYSDVDKYIIQNETGNEYTEAIDLPGKFTYNESDKFIEEENKNEQQFV